ncbi:exodeoxyribonuclease VII large subunit [Limnobacter thiooxidans]|uniref:Exodeoxyribonuclease 7 large subunit n=1 Tax=Limnobacter thiooxidans TaxID=131080 RepID=A0AA86JJ65_9BURK|nr:exodeoxyribonuclease VII large subunit [Limnobacter sp.]MCZ8014140.1 exodeoxyribonuclease VII large subunit [Limnobacter sp.]RZS38166.1 exodeoxyribonuclease VII large subunit [Limnobacter thiooxidans]BET25387.1 exodeoxyribonuclease VII large subunit [Limnobacter thiooxidans]
MVDFKTVFSVSQFARHLNDHFRTEFGAIRIQGEVASFTRASSGHWYFGLKDSTAQLKAVMFRQRNILAGFLPAVGDKVEVLAQLAMYEQRGELQLIVDVMKKAGQGNLHEQYLQLKAKLSQEGLFDLNRKKPVPTVVFNLGVVTSLQAAALADVKQALARRAPHVKYTVYHTAVQGEQAAAQIIDALQKADAAGHEVLILCRGGGSLEDLWSFNIEAVVRAVAACKTPVVVGVGHESDVTLAEFAADLRAATPTAAAELISKPTQELLTQVHNLHSNLRRALRHRAQLLVQQLDRAEMRLLTPTAYVNALESKIHNALTRMPRLVQRQLQQHEAAVSNRGQSLTLEMRKAQALANQRSESAAAAIRMAQNRQLTAMESRLQRLGAVVEAVSPQRTLERGYAFLQPEVGDEVVRSVEQVKNGDNLRATLADGEIVLNVLEKTSLRGPSAKRKENSR